jgi:hypothetical protein
MKIYGLMVFALFSGLFSMQPGTDFSKVTDDELLASVKKEKDSKKIKQMLLTFNRMVKEGQKKERKTSFPFALKAANYCIDNTDSIVKEASINIFKELVKQQYQPAYSGASDSLLLASVKAEKDSPEIKKMLLTFNRRVKAGRNASFLFALDAANYCIDNTDSIVKEVSINVFKELVKQQYEPAYPNALIHAKASVDSKNVLVAVAAIYTIKALVVVKYKAGIEFAKKFIENDFSGKDGRIQKAFAALKAECDELTSILKMLKASVEDVSKSLRLIQSRMNGLKIKLSGSR